MTGEPHTQSSRGELVSRDHAIRDDEPRDIRIGCRAIPLERVRTASVVEVSIAAVMGDGQVP